MTYTDNLLASLLAGTRRIFDKSTTAATVKLLSEHSRTDGEAPTTGCPCRSRPASRKAVAKKVEQTGRKPFVEFIAGVAPGLTRQFITCKTCHGRGTIAGIGPDPYRETTGTCENCNGAGELELTDD